MNTGTQQNIQIAGIRDGIVILKTGGYRLILQVSAVNFALKSEEEQNSLIFQYQSFLNSLHFPIEIVMQSKKLDLSPYLKKVKDKMDKQTNELLKMQTGDYIEFVSKLINIANIMKKTFYVVIPYEPITLKNVGLLDRFFGSKGPTHLKISETEFESHKEQLTQRANVTATGLGGMGLHCLQLGTEQIIELFYKIYNPEIAGKERIGDTGLITSPIVTMQSSQATQTEQPTGLASASASQDKQVIDNTAIVMQTQKDKAQQERIKEMKESGATPSQKIENKAQGLNTTASSGGEQQPPQAQTEPPVQPSQ